MSIQLTTGKDFLQLSLSNENFKAQVFVKTEGLTESYSRKLSSFRENLNLPKIQRCTSSIIFFFLLYKVCWHQVCKRNSIVSSLMDLPEYTRNSHLLGITQIIAVPCGKCSEHGLHSTLWEHRPRNWVRGTHPSSLDGIQRSLPGRPVQDLIR